MIAGRIALLAAAATATLCACTAGGTMTPSSGGGTGSLAIAVNLTLNPPPVSIPLGTGGGYSPDAVNVVVGSTIQFTNTDTFAHTATGIPGAANFPASSPFSVSAQTQNGSAVSGSWSSGTLPPGGRSQPIKIDAPGTYLFGCFFHYGAPMRGEIVAH